MKKIYQKLLIGVLSLAILFTGVYGMQYFGVLDGVLAKGDSPSGPNRDAAGGHLTLAEATQYANAFPQDPYEDNRHNYLLEVHTGIYSGKDCKQIAIRYYATKADKDAGNLSVQYINAINNDTVSKVQKFDTNDGYGTGKMLNAALYALCRKNINPYILFAINSGESPVARWSMYRGYREHTYELFSESTYDTSKLTDTVSLNAQARGKYRPDYYGGSFYEYYQLNEYVVYLREDEKYGDYVSGIFDYNNYGTYQKPQESNDYSINGFPVIRDNEQPGGKRYLEAFAANGTEYILFNSEYGIYQLESVDFYCESSGSAGTWSMEGWVLYDIKMSNSVVYGLNNYAFVSDNYFLDITGKEAIAYANSSNDMNPQLSYDAGFPGFQPSGYYRFVLDSDANRKKLDAEGNQLNYYFFRNGGKESNTPYKYTFSINIDDTYGAGIETFNKVATFSHLPLDEVLTARITYTDANGLHGSVSLPVLTNALLNMSLNDEYQPNETYFYLGGTVGDKPAKAASYTDALSYAQQGEHIVFSVNFPGKVTLNDITLNYLNPFDPDDFFIIRDITVSEKEGRNIASTCLMDLTNGLAFNSIETASKFSADPATVAYETKQISGGYIFDNIGGEQQIAFYKPSESNKITKSYGDMYLITLETDTVSFADTVDDDINISFEYMSTAGATGLSQEYNLKEACNEFYGYNPSVQTTVDKKVETYDSSDKRVAGETSTIDGYRKTIVKIEKEAGICTTTTTVSDLVDGTYYYCMRQGNKVKFFVQIKDVERFLKLRIKKSDGQDEWQIQSVEIRKVAPNGISERTMTGMDPTKHYGNVQYNRMYDRTVAGSVIFYKNDADILVQADSEVEFDLENSAVDVDEYKRDFTEYYYSMDYKTAISDLRFGTPAYTYEVRVHVASNAALSAADGTDSNGCGSTANYYFQLIFTNGKSAYVLANTQLKSDSFRAGQTESFLISTNEYYGDVVAVKIVPDDTSVESDTTDKLNIDQIEIIKDNAKTADKRFVCENIGWVGLEKRDVSDDVNKVGRTEAELAKVCNVAYSSYMLEFEFNIAISDYVDSNDEELEQFYGNLTADIVYYNAAGEKKTIPVNVVEAIYSYINKSPKTAAYNDSNHTVRYISDPKYMFRAKHIDRFIVGIDDATRIESITFNGIGYTGCFIPIEGISIKILKSSGTLSINKQGDYERVYTVEPALLTDEIPNKRFPVLLEFPANTYTSYKFTFDYNVVPEMGEDVPIESVIGRVPKSANDSLNVFVYLKNGTPAPTVAGKEYKPVVKMYYSSLATNNTYVSSCDTLKVRQENGAYVLYATDLSASNMAMLTDVVLQAPNQLGRTDLKVDHAVVQRVRNGVVINTYQVLFGSTNFAKSGGVNMQGKYTYNGFNQKLYVALGNTSETSKLVNEKYDIAAAIRYTSSTDSNTKKTVFVSPNVFATDAGATTVHAGSVLEFNFDESYIDNIVGIDLVAVNGGKGNSSETDETEDTDTARKSQLNITLESALIVSYGPDEEILNTYSITTKEDTPIYSGGRTFNVTSAGLSDPTSLHKLDFSFKTLPSSLNVDSAGNDPIRMIINYTDVEGTSVDYEVSDIRRYAGGNNYFAQGQTADLSLLLPGLSSIHYIKLIPYDYIDSNIARWNLESITFNLDGEENGHTIPVNRTITEISQYDNSVAAANNIFTVSSVSMDVTTVIGDKTYSPTESTAGTLECMSGSSMVFSPVVGGSCTKGYNILIERALIGTSNFSAVSNVGPISDPTYTFTPQQESQDYTYRFTFTPAESSTNKKVVTVNVASKVSMSMTVVQGSNSFVGDDAEKTLSLYAGKVVSITPNISGSPSGKYNVKIERNDGGGYTLYDELSGQTAKPYEFTPEATDKDYTYKLTFTAADDTTVSKVITFTVGKVGMSIDVIYKEAHYSADNKINAIKESTGFVEFIAFTPTMTGLDSTEYKVSVDKQNITGGTDHGTEKDIYTATKQAGSYDLTMPLNSLAPGEYNFIFTFTSTSLKSVTKTVTVYVDAR